MVTTTISATIDVKVWEIARKNNLNISRICNNAIKQAVMDLNVVKKKKKELKQAKDRQKILEPVKEAWLYLDENKKKLIEQHEKGVLDMEKFKRYQTIAHTFLVESGLDEQKAREAIYKRDV